MKKTILIKKEHKDVFKPHTFSSSSPAVCGRLPTKIC